MKNELKHTAHSTYRCEYHIVFAPKYRRKEIYGAIKKDIGEILRKLCNEKKVEIIEAELCPDHVHMLVSIPPYISIEFDSPTTFISRFIQIQALLRRERPRFITRLNSWQARIRTIIISKRQQTIFLPLTKIGFGK